MNTNKDAKTVLMNWMADREGFEPSVTFPPHTLSKRAHSTTLTPALGGREARKRISCWQSIFHNIRGTFGIPPMLGVARLAFMGHERRP